MLQGILEIFTSEQKAEAMLANPIIELIFMTLFITFIVTLTVHLLLFLRLKKIRNYVKETGRIDIEPLRTFREEFDAQQNKESLNVETFVQERFSSWSMFHIPVINLIKLIQMTVSVFILIGVLGTFIGLTISLGSINAGGDQLVENVANVLSGIDVAFYTSIFGMGFSLIVTVLIKTLNTEYILTDMMLMVESNLGVKDEKLGMGHLIRVSETINQSILNLQETNQDSLKSIVDAFAGFQAYTTGLQKSAEDLAAFNEGLSENLIEFQALFKQMETVTDGFGEGTRELNKNFKALFTYFEKADRRNERMTTAFENTYEKVQTVSKAQVDSLLQFEETVGEFQGFTTSLLEEQATIHISLDKITQKSDELVRTFAAHNKEFKQIFGTNLSKELHGISSNLGKFSTGFDQLGTSILKLPEALEIINQTQIEYKHLLADRFEELKEFNQSFSNHLKDHSAEASSFEKQMRDATMTYEQMGVKNNQLINEINTTLSKMDHTFNQRENQVENNTRILKDTLSSYAGNVEGTLSNKLDQVVRQIGDSMDGTSDGIKQEFVEIRRISEGIQHSYSSSMQQLMQDFGREIHTLNRNLSTIQQQLNSSSSRIGRSDNEY